MKHVKLISLGLIASIALSSPVYASETASSSVVSESAEEMELVLSASSEAAEEITLSASSAPEEAVAATVTETPAPTPTQTPEPTPTETPAPEPTPEPQAEQTAEPAASEAQPAETQAELELSASAAGSSSSEKSNESQKVESDKSNEESVKVEEPKEEEQKTEEVKEENKEENKETEESEEKKEEEKKEEESEFDDKDSENEPETGSVEAHADIDVIATLQKYAKAYGIEQYIPYLYGIIICESGGTYHPDGGGFMGISDSGGGISIGQEESIKEGCRIFKYCLDHAMALGCDLETAIQSYNYGPAFADYVAANGKKYTFRLAEAFAKEKSGGVKVPYKNAMSIAANGGWMYKYGCMFYVPAVMSVVNGSQHYLDEEIAKLHVGYMDTVENISDESITEYSRLASEIQRIDASSFLLFILRKTGYAEGLTGAQLYGGVETLESYQFKKKTIEDEMPVLGYGDILVDAGANNIGIYADNDEAYVFNLNAPTLFAKENIKETDIRWQSVYTPPMKEAKESAYTLNIDFSGVADESLPGMLNVFLIDPNTNAAIAMQRINPRECGGAVTFKNTTPGKQYSARAEEIIGYACIASGQGISYVKAE